MKHTKTENILKPAELLRVAVISGTKSCWMPVTTDAPQGSVLGSILFSIFINNTGDGTAHTLASHSKGPRQAGEMGKQESHEVQQRKVQSPTPGEE